jgi:putative SOS response-associated peptidase YedK
MCNKLRYNPNAIQQLFNHMRRSGQWSNADFDTFSEARMETRFLVPPSRPAPVLSSRGGRVEASMMTFGWPGYAGRGLQLMARGETVTEKRMFKDAFRKERCLLLVNGFFDSVDMGRWTQPYHLHQKDDGVMGMAALWRPGSDESFCIMSCEPNAVVRPIIDRMPVILAPENWQPWLDGITPEADLKAMLRPCPADEMEAFPVTRNVNKPGWDGPECAVPILPEQPEFNLF